MAFDTPPRRRVSSNPPSIHRRRAASLVPGDVADATQSPQIRLLVLPAPTIAIPPHTPLQLTVNGGNQSGVELFFSI